MRLHLVRKTKDNIIQYFQLPSMISLENLYKKKFYAEVYLCFTYVCLYVHGYITYNYINIQNDTSGYPKYIN